MSSDKLGSGFNAVVLNSDEIWASFEKCTGLQAAFNFL